MLSLRDPPNFPLRTQSFIINEQNRRGALDPNIVLPEQVSTLAERAAHVVKIQKAIVMFLDVSNSRIEERLEMANAGYS